VSEPFNPFVHWLGMHGNAPANYYELLQLPTFEDNVAVITQAAQRLTSHLQSISPGPYVNEHQALLDQIYAALACLLDPAAKSRYDTALHGPVQWTEPGPSLPTPASQGLAFQGAPAQNLSPQVAPPQDPTPWTPPTPPVASPPVQRVEPLLRQNLYGAIPLPQQLLAPALRPSERDRAEVSLTGPLLFLLSLTIGVLGVAAALFLTDRLPFQPSQLASRPAKAGEDGRQPDRPPPAGNENKTTPASVATASTTSSDKPVSKAETDKGREVSKDASAPGTASSASKADPSSGQNQVKDALQQAYAAMAERKLPQAENFLKIARENVQTDEQVSQVRRAGLVCTHLGEFWRVINAKIKTIQPLDVLPLADTRAVVASVDDQVLTIKAEGRLHRHSINNLPGWVVIALADATLVDNPPSKAVFATFLAVDAQGDRDRAKRLFAEAAQSGLNVRNAMPDLEFLPVSPRER
jgi:hypothetical protein